MGRRSAARDALEAAALGAVLGCLRRLPAAAAGRVGRGLGRLSYRLLRRRREIALGNLERAFGDGLDAVARRRIARQSFESIGDLLADFARLPDLTTAALDDAICHEGWDGYSEALDRGRGVLILAAHFGSWEVIPAAQALRGAPMSFVVRPADNPRVEAMVRAIRTLRGNQVIDKRAAVRECLRRLRRGETVGILIDQHVPRERGVATTLLGQTVWTTPVLAALASRTGAAVLPAFAIRTAPGRHRIVLGPEVEAVAGGGDEAVAEMTQRCVDVVGRYVARHPEQWLWMHRRFRDGDPPAAT